MMARAAEIAWLAAAQMQGHGTEVMSVDHVIYRMSSDSVCVCRLI